METKQIRSLSSVLALSAAVGLLAGCASNSQSTANQPTANPAAATMAPASPTLATRYKADDGRTIEIGRSSASNDGLVFKEPHMDKCWLADGFRFTGYDTLYIAPTLSTAKLHNDQEQQPQELAKQNLCLELQRVLANRGIFPSIVLSEPDIKPGARVLRLQNTIIEYAKGGGAARYFAGLYGAGQPVLRVQGKLTDGDKSVFEFEARRSGVSGGSRMFGAYMKDTDIQTQDIQSMTLDLADFMSAVSGKFQPK